MMPFTIDAAKGRLAILVGITLLIALTASAGQAAAHNPACVHVAGGDGPHYDDNPQTGSESALAHNPNLRDVERDDSEHPDTSNSIHHREGSCSVGNS